MARDVCKNDSTIFVHQRLLAQISGSSLRISFSGVATGRRKEPWPCGFVPQGQGLKSCHGQASDIANLRYSRVPPQ